MPAAAGRKLAAVDLNSDFQLRPRNVKAPRLLTPRFFGP